MNPTTNVILRVRAQRNILARLLFMPGDVSTYLSSIPQ
jgi:hypothetical protein